MTKGDWLMRVYIAGPIKGKPDGNRAAFQAAAAHMARCGYTAVNPHDVAPHQHPGECPPGPSAGEGSEHSAACHLRTDLAAMLSCDAILLLFGWEYSTGARAEFNAATVAGLRVLFQTEHYPECSETVAAEPDSETVVAEPDSETVVAEPDSETVVAEPDSSRSRFILFTPEGKVDITDYIVSGGLSPFSDPRGSCV